MTQPTKVSSLPASRTLRASLTREAALADPRSALQLESLEKCGVKKMLVVFLLFFFSHRNFRPGDQTYPAARTALAARSLEFNVSSKILTSSGKKQEVEMLEWNTCSGWLHCHTWSIATALKELQEFFKMPKCNCQGTRGGSRGSTQGRTFAIFCRGTLKCFRGRLTKYSNEPLAFSLHKAQLKVSFRVVKDNFKSRVKTQEKYQWM